MKAYRTLPLLLLLALPLPRVACAQAQAQAPSPHAQVHAQPQAKPGSGLSLGDAVSHVQRETNGQVLSAESRRWDRRTEYRIKVLTPQGHVRVMTVPAASGDNGHALPSTRFPPARRGGGKEKH